MINCQISVGGGLPKSALHCLVLSGASCTYRQVSNIRRTLDDNKSVDNSCRRCSNYIFIIDLTLGFSELGTDNCKTRWESFKF